MSGAFVSIVQQAKTKTNFSPHGVTSTCCPPHLAVFTITTVPAHDQQCGWVFVCVCEREREREGGRGCPVFPPSVRSPNCHLSVGASCEQDRVPLPPSPLDCPAETLNISRARRLGRGHCRSPLPPPVPSSAGPMAQDRRDTWRPASAPRQAPR
jgi:hypothetical protein